MIDWLITIGIKPQANDEINIKKPSGKDGFFYVISAPIAGKPITAHSERRLFTGFATAAFIAWKLTVSNVISKAPIHETTNIHQETVV